jgi:hypothetical protein
MDLDFDTPSVLGRHAHFWHVGIAVHDLESAQNDVGKAFGLEWAPIASDVLPNLQTPEGPSDWAARRCQSIGALVPFELLQGSPGSTWDTPASKPVVTHHLAYWTNDIPGEVRALEKEGWTVEIDMLDADGNPSMFAYMVKPGSVRVELVDVSRRPAYLELVGRSD